MELGMIILMNYGKTLFISFLSDFKMEMKE